MLWTMRTGCTHLPYLHKGRTEICQYFAELLSLHVQTPLEAFPRSLCYFRQVTEVCPSWRAGDY